MADITDASDTLRGMPVATFKEQTIYLLYSLVHRDTKEFLPDLSAHAYECIRHQNIQAVFGPDVTSVQINRLMDRLERHGQKMRKDENLERLLDKISLHPGRDVILEAARNLMITDTDWNKILVFLIVGLELCRKTELNQCHFIVDTIADGINLVAGWIQEHGGWLELLKPSPWDTITSPFSSLWHWLTDDTKKEDTSRKVKQPADPGTDFHAYDF